MSKPPSPDDPADLDAIARAIAALKAMPETRSGPEQPGPRQHNATLMSLELALRHSHAGNRRAHARLAYDGCVRMEAPAAVSGATRAPQAGQRLAILDIGRSGALLLNRSEISLADEALPAPLATLADGPAWMSGTVVARRGPMLHVAFPPDLSEEDQAELDLLLETLHQRDVRLGRRMARFAGFLEQRCACLPPAEDTNAFWSDQYMAVADGRFVSPASSALEPLLGGDLMRLVSRLPWPAVAMAVDRNGHIAVALGDQITRKSWRGTFAEFPALILAARFAQEPALVTLASPANAGEAYWLASAPLAIRGQRWGCVAVMTPFRAPECAGPNPA